MRAARRAAGLLAVAALALPAVAVGAIDRPMGHVFDWSHELNEEELPSWNPRTAPPIPAGRWYRTIDQILSTAGRDGLWFSGFGALPFDIPGAYVRAPAKCLRTSRERVGKPLERR